MVRVREVLLRNLKGCGNGGENEKLCSIKRKCITREDEKPIAFARLILETLRGFFANLYYEGRYAKKFHYH